MPRYFFHIADGDTISEDREGEVLADLDAAHAEAVNIVIDLICDSLQCLGLMKLHREVLIYGDDDSRGRVSFGSALRG